MNKIPNENKISPRMKAFIWIIFLFLIGIIIGFIVSRIGVSQALNLIEELNLTVEPRQQIIFLNVYTITMMIICIDIILLFGLLVLYVDSYRKVKSSFMLGLSLFIFVLFFKSIMMLSTIHSLFTNYIRLIPAVSQVMGLTGLGAGGFGYLLFIFEIIAASILLYISME